MFFPYHLLLFLLQTLIPILFRSRASIAMENLLLRSRLAIHESRGKKVRYRPQDRILFALCSRLLPRWERFIGSLQPDTVRRWHRENLYRLWWNWKCRSAKPRFRKITPEIRLLVRRMAQENSWGAPKIVGELQKLGILLALRSVQNILGKPKNPGGRPRDSWTTFLKAQGKGVWMCDFFTVVTIGFRQIYVFVILELQSRRILHWNVTEHPTSAWTYNQVRHAACENEPPTFLVHDRDGKFGPDFDKRIEKILEIRGIRTPYRSPKANAHVERCIGTLRRECLDRTFIFGERHLRRVLREFIGFYNTKRPHQGIGQKIPEGTLPLGHGDRILAEPILGGLHHHYFRSAA